MGSRDRRRSRRVGRARARAAVRTTVETLVWTLVLGGVWLATLTVVTTTELVFAAGVGLALAPVALTSRRALGVVVRPRAAWAGWLVRAPAAVVVDTARLAAALVRAVRRGEPVGADRELVLPPEDTPRARTRAALGAIVVSSTPGSYVVDVDPATPDHPGTLTVHALGDRPSGLERAVSR
jgi:hypothetical protein